MLSNNQITYHNNSTGQLILPVNTITLINHNDPVFTFNEVVERINLNKYIKSSHLSRDDYNSTSLLKIILFSFMINVRSTRSIANLCANDFKLMWLSNNIRPSHNTISRFIKHNLTNCWKYQRTSRKEIENVKVELKLISLEYNFMKYHNKKYRKTKLLN